MNEARPATIFPSSARGLVAALIPEARRLNDRIIRLEMAIDRDDATIADVFEQVRNVYELAQRFAEQSQKTYAHAMERVAVERNSGRLDAKPPASPE